MDDKLDFSRFKAKAPRPSPNELYRGMAESGNFEGLFRAYHESMPTLFNIDAFFALLQRAVSVAARADPVGFSQRSYASMLEFTAYLGLRSQMVVERILTQVDHGCGTRAEDYWLRCGPHQDALVALREFQSHLANLLQAQAATARTWQLARQRQEPTSANGDLLPERPRKATRKRAATTARRRPIGKTVNRSKFVSLNGNGKAHRNGKAP